MAAFRTQGPLLSFTGATTAPTSVLPTGETVGNVQRQQYVLTNTDGTTDCVVGWGATDTIAKAASVVANASQNCYYLLRGTQVVISAQVGSSFTGTTAASTAIIKVQSGEGD